MAKKRKVPLTRGAKKVVQQDMFPARKKLAEQARLGQLPPPEPMTGFEKRAAAKRDISILMGYCDGLKERVDALEKRMQSLAHAVELLSEVTKRMVPPKKVKQWTSEEYMRLDGEYDLMLHVDKEIDYAVLADVHRCTIPELYEALRKIGKAVPGA